MTTNRENDLVDRTFQANDRAVSTEGNHVLVILNRALRGEDNPVIDAASVLAAELNLPLVVYSELDVTVDYASERLCYFILGAFRESAIALSNKKIQCVQVLKKAEDENILQLLAAGAAAIYTDDVYTHWDRARIQKILDIATVTVFLVDASRLVPTRQLPQNLKTTPEFRKAHGKLREKYIALRQEANNSELINEIVANEEELSTTHNFATYSDRDLLKLLAECQIERDLKISQEHPPTLTEVDNRINILKTEILAKYKWIRNNPALEYSTSQLSPYLHFGMVSPHRILAEVESTEIPKSYTYKFRDEFLTWREWFHYRAFHTPNLHEFDSLPDEAKKTLKDRASDPRPDLCSFEDILKGNTPDSTWNAAQREWLNTGWLHNNLRMYWAKQILRFTETPQEAWNTACYLNDYISLDGRDPATYASIQWAFGDGKPGYKEKPIYGWVATKGDRAILKRQGMKEWSEIRTRKLESD